MFGGSRSDIFQSPSVQESVRLLHETSATEDIRMTSEKPKKPLAGILKEPRIWVRIIYNIIRAL